jgi:HK97 family phage prohead protease
MQTSPVEYREVRLLETKLMEEPGAFSGYGAIFGNQDNLGDVIQEGAFTSTLKEWKKERGKWPPMLLQHGGGFFGGGAEDMLPVGQWVDMQENTRGLKVDGKLFAINTEKGQYIYEGLKSGVLDGLSIGFKVRQFIQGTKPTEPDRTLTDLDLWEVSIVTFPANPKARVTAVKALTVEELRDLEDVLGDRGLSRADRLKAVSVFKRWLQRDAEAPNSRPRDEVVPDEDMGQLVALIERGTASYVREALRRD